MKKVLGCLICFAVLLSACNLPFGQVPAPANVRATLPPAVAQGGQPVQLGGQAAPTSAPEYAQVTLPPLTATAAAQSAPPAQPPAGGSAPQPTSPPATGGGSAAPTQPPADSSGGGSSAPQPTEAPPDTLIGGNLAQTPKGLDIKSLSASPTTIYDGGCSDIGPIGAVIQFELINPAVLKEAVVTFHYLDNNGQVVGQDHSSYIYYNGSSLFSYDTTPVTGQSQSYLNGSEGKIEYWVAAQDTDGAWVVSNVQYITVLPCSVVGSPVTAPVINYFNGPSSANEGERIYLEWSVSDAPCGVFLDGNAVQPVGEHSYVIPGNVAPLTITHTLEARGGDCGNPASVTETVTFDVEVLPVTFNAPLLAGSSGFQDATDNNDWFGQIVAGDDEYDHKLVALMMFDISSLSGVGMQLQSATLNLGGCSETGAIYGIQPFTILAASSSIGTRTVGTLNGSCSGSFNVTDMIFASLGESAILFMVSPGGTDYDGVADQATYSNPTLTIVYLPNP